MRLQQSPPPTPLSLSLSLSIRWHTSTTQKAKLVQNIETMCQPDSAFGSTDFSRRFISPSRRCLTHVVKATGVEYKNVFLIDRCMQISFLQRVVRCTVDLLPNELSRHDAEICKFSEMSQLNRRIKWYGCVYIETGMMPRYVVANNHRRCCCCCCTKRA